MKRRRFDHLVLELSLALDRNIPRYALWMHLHEVGLEPERLAPREVLRFLDRHLARFLSSHGLAIRPNRLRRLRRAVARFDPTVPTPDERFARP